LNLYKARVRRNHGRLPSNGFIKSAPERRARAHFFPESALPINDTTREHWHDWRESIPSYWGRFGIAVQRRKST
jgi:hypothetical protein